MTDPALPAYGGGTIADLLPAVGAHLGQPGAVDTLGLPSAQRYVVLLVDGLGWEQREHWQAVAPHLAELAAGREPITCGAPSTTSTSITSLGTGLAPGEHGIAGYSFRYPGTGQVLNTLAWPAGVHALDVQPQPTWFERLARLGVHTATVAPQRFAGSGLTLSALRGPHFVPVVDESDHDGVVELVADAAATGERSLVYAYERGLDHAGHGHGVGSPEWLVQLGRCDALAASLRRALPADVVLVVTGDHGMVNVPPRERLVAEDDPRLMQDVSALAGEGRLRQLYAPPGRAEAVRERWRERLGERAWVLLRDEAFAAGWFGPRNARVADRFGDVIVAMAGNGAVMSRTLPGEFSLVGMHGSLTLAELAVPLLVA